MASVNISTYYEEHHITVNASSALAANDELNLAKVAIDNRLTSEKQNKEKADG